jgi:primosomal protein N' (replication factor Y)
LEHAVGWAWPQPVDLLGPVAGEDGVARLVLRVPRAQGAALSRALALLQSHRSARKLPAVRVQVDPVALG